MSEFENTIRDIQIRQSRVEMQQEELTSLFEKQIVIQEKNQGMLTQLLLKTSYHDDKIVRFEKELALFSSSLNKDMKELKTLFDKRIRTIEDWKIKLSLAEHFASHKWFYRIIFTIFTVVFFVGAQILKAKDWLIDHIIQWFK